MSTEIMELEGTQHVPSKENAFKVDHVPSFVHLNRFFNGKDTGPNIQLTVMQSTGESAYIHLTQRQCVTLAIGLLEAFDYEKHPSE